MSGGQIKLSGEIWSAITDSGEIGTGEKVTVIAIDGATGDAQAAVLRAKGESEAIEKVFKAIHDADADDRVLAYQYLQQLKEIANGQASKVWVIPAELSGAAQKIAEAFKDQK